MPRPISVLVVLAAPPLPEGGAPGKCALGLLRGLAAHGVRVCAIAADQYFSGELPSGVAIDVLPVEEPSRGLASYPRRLRRPRGDLRRGAFAARVRELAASTDVVHLEQTETAWCDEGISTPSLVHVHNRCRRDESLGAPWRSQFRRVAEQRLAERAALRRHRYLVASSPEVAGDLRARAPHAVVTHAPLCLDPAFYTVADLSGPPTAGIVGTAAWAPTLRAMRRLVDGVWPEVRRRCPEARLEIAGRGTDRLVAPPAEAGIRVRGPVPSAVEFLSGLSVLVYPLDRGSGMKVKVLEALACGVPVVTTRAGAEGIEATDGGVVAEDDAAVAAATSALLSDERERRERGAAAREAFDRRYAPEPATTPLVDLYARMLR